MVTILTQTVIGGRERGLLHLTRHCTLKNDARLQPSPKKSAKFELLTAFPESIVYTHKKRDLTALTSVSVSPFVMLNLLGYIVFQGRGRYPIRNRFQNPKCRVSLFVCFAYRSSVRLLD